MRLIKQIKLLSKIIKHNIHYYTGKFVYPYRVEITSTYLCNSKCKICHIWKYYQNKNNNISQELNLNELTKTFKNINKNLFYLAIGGGEPTLRNDLIQIIKSVTKNCPNLLYISMGINGLQTKDTVLKIRQILKELPKSIDLKLTISIDGPKQVHNIMRGINDSFTRSNATFNQLKKFETKYRNFSVTKELTICDENINELKNIDKYKDYIITFQNDSKFYMVDNNKKTGINKKLQYKITSQLIKNKNKFGIINLITNDFLKKSLLFQKNKLNIKCYSGRSTIFIDPIGNVYSCINQKVKFGNIKDNKYDIKKVLKKSNDKLVILNKCKDCWTPCEAYTTIIQNKVMLK